MPKVLRIINRFNIGGPTYNAAYLSKYLSDDFETLLVGGQKDESEDSSEFILKQLGLNPIIIPEMKREINFKNDRIAYQKIKQLIAEFKPDIVHTHASKAGAIGRLAAYNMKVPIIVHTFHGHVFHSYFGKAKTNAYKKIEKYLAKKSSSIIAISSIQKQELSEKHKICKKEKIKVIPLGFDLDRFRENKIEKRVSFRKEWNLDEETIAIGIIGRLVPIKNHHFFLNVAKSIQEQTSKSIQFFIVGDGKLKDELINYCKEINITYSEKQSDIKPLITFTSWIKDIDVVNAGLDIITLTSKNEGTPVSLIEAQASGKPIVSTNVGGIENIVKIGQTALLSEVGDEENFTKNLLKLIENRSLREEMSSKGEHVFKSYHYLRLVKDIESHYYRLLSR